MLRNSNPLEKNLDLENLVKSSFLTEQVLSELDIDNTPSTNADKKI